MIFKTSKFIYMIISFKFSKLIKEAVRLIHNRKYIDHYWYIKSNPGARSPIVEEEKKKARAFFDHPDVKTLFQDYYETSYARKDARSGDVPELYDGYEYFTNYAFFTSGNDYMIVQRKNKDGSTQTVLDLKSIPFLKRYHETLKLTKIQFSDDHRLIGFGIDLMNNEEVVWLFKFLDDEAVIKTKLYECFDAKFTRDGTGIVYTQYDDKFRPCKLMFHKLGTSQDADIVLFEEQDEQFYLDLQQTKDKEYFILLSQSKAENEILLINRDDPTKIEVLFPRRSGVLQYAQHHESGFFVLTNENAYDFKVLKQEGATYAEYYKPQDGEVLQEVDLFQKHLVLYFAKDSESFIRVIELASKQVYNIIIPSSLVYTDHKENKKSILRHWFNKFIKRDDSSRFLNKQIENEVLAATISPGVNHNYISHKFNFHLSTPLVYDQVYQFDLQSKTLSKLQDSSLTGKPFFTNQFTCTRIFAPSSDGTNIPITLVHRKDLKLNRQNKLLLHSYGAYGVAQDVPFNVVYLRALERGWVMAYAHLRGGNERGQQWHKSALRENKMNSINDLLSAAETLVAQGYTHPALLCGLAASAGATTLAAAVNMRPDIWKCVVLLSPFLDVLNSLLDESLPLTKSDYIEFGNPNEQRYFESILSYSPYDNLTQQPYPSIYVSAGEDDFRAPLWNVLKYTEKFRRLSQPSERVVDMGNQGLVLDVMEGGHYGGAGAQSVIEERARYMAFLEYYAGKGNKEISIENLTQKIDERIRLVQDK